MNPSNPAIPVPEALLERLRSHHPLPAPLPTDPFALFKSWLDAAERHRHTPNPNAMCVATVDPDGTPSARILLCRGVNIAQGSITFFTNYTSDKAAALDAHPVACVNFHFDHAEQQVRIKGPIVKASTQASDEYFNARPWESRLSAWMSHQSQPLASREELFARVPGILQKLNLTPDEILSKGNETHIPRPPHWGGYHLIASCVELWLGGPGRLHDRARWTRNVTPNAAAFDVGPWKVTRLNP